MIGCNIEHMLFFDIETTGLSARSSNLYLIGTAYYQGQTWHVSQFFAESPEHEGELLASFSHLCKEFRHIITFNGNRFDIPYMTEKYTRNGMDSPFDALQSFDIYKQISPYKKLLGLSDCKQKTIELFLGINREDEYDGGKLIPVYQKYVEDKDPESLRLLLLHNTEDVKGMFTLLKMLEFQSFFNLFRNMPNTSVRTDEPINDSDFDILLPVRARKVQANYYKDFNGEQKKEVYMKLSLSVPLPAPLSRNLDGCFFKAEGDEASLRVPMFEKELKYYYSNYKDYYYLPKEDMAIHKSIASFVDKAFREKATAENCYTKKEGQYLQEWDLVFTPFFKEDYKDKCFFFDLNENVKKSRFAMSLYASHVIAHILEV